MRRRPWDDEQLSNMGVPDQSVQQQSLDQAREADPFLAELLDSDLMTSDVDSALDKTSRDIERSIEGDQ